MAAMSSVSGMIAASTLFAVVAIKVPATTFSTRIFGVLVSQSFISSTLNTGARWAR